MRVLWAARGSPVDREKHHSFGPLLHSSAVHDTFHEDHAARDGGGDDLPVASGTSDPVGTWLGARRSIHNVE